MKFLVHEDNLKCNYGALSIHLDMSLITEMAAKGRCQDVCYVVRLGVGNLAKRSFDNLFRWKRNL